MMKRKLFKIIIDTDVETIINIYVYATLKLLFEILTLVLAFIYTILHYIVKSNGADIGFIIAILISMILAFIMTFMHSRTRNKFLKRLDTGEDNPIENKIIKKDKYRCP